MAPKEKKSNNLPRLVEKKSFLNPEHLCCH